ncbi:MAG: amidohydrolase family protein [Gemmatimonadaceae bacterium]|nr:amidohydrolase family protein [Gemmatimonadaceae bacterium]
MIVVRARWVLPVDSAPIRDGAVAIDGDRIAWVGRADRAPAGERIETGDSLLMPALVNAHTHLDLTVFRGMLEGLDFPSWIRTLVAAKRSVMDEAALALSARAGVREGFRAGIGTFGDTSDAPAAFDALRALGARGVAYQEVFGPDPDIAEVAAADLASRAQRLQHDATPLVRVGLSPHAPYSVSDALYREVAALAASGGWPVAVHIAESADESSLVSDGTGAFADALRGRGIAVARRAASPLHLLHDTGVLATRPLLIHALRCRAEERGLAASAGASVAHCPCSNAKLGHGVAPLREWIDAGVPVGLGSDSMASNNRMHILEEARVAGLTQAARFGKADVVSTGELLHLATLGGAQALGLADDIGSLEPGKAADLAVFPLGGLAAAADLDPIAAATYAMGGTEARWLFVAGRAVLADGRFAEPDDADAAAMPALAGRLAEWRAARTRE